MAHEDTKDAQRDSWELPRGGLYWTHHTESSFVPSLQSIIVRMDLLWV
jgi:hypothetical protein